MNTSSSLRTALLTLALALGATLTAPAVAVAQEAASAPVDAGAGYDNEVASEVAPKASGLGVVRLHIDSPKPVKLVEHLGTSYAQAGGYAVQIEHGRIVCGTPCDKPIDGSNGQTFIVEGDGVPASESFVMADRQGDTVVHVDPGSYAMIYGGNAMLSLGVIGMITGISLAAVGAAIDRPTSDDFLPIGGALIGGSTALIGGGIALLVLGDTDVEIESKPTESGPARPTRIEPNYIESKPTEIGPARPTRIEPNYWAGQF